MKFIFDDCEILPDVGGSNVWGGWLWEHLCRCWWKCLKFVYRIHRKMFVRLYVYVTYTGLIFLAIIVCAFSRLLLRIPIIYFLSVCAPWSDLFECLMWVCVCRDSLDWYKFRAISFAWVFLFMQIYWRSTTRLIVSYLNEELTIWPIDFIFGMWKYFLQTRLKFENGLCQTTPS